MSIPANIIPDRFLTAARAAYGDSLALVLYRIPENRSLADDTELTEHFLTPQERAVFTSFRLEKRKRQWLAGRLCAKQALHEHSGISDSFSIAILNRPDGSPYALVDGIESPTLHLSLSHSGELAAGLVADNYCGIDIQEEQETLLNVQQRFCNRHEDTLLCQHLPLLSPILRLNLLWSCKEALRKMFNHQHIPGFLQLSCTAVIQQDDDLFHFRFHLQQYDQVLSVLCSVQDNYALAVSVLKGDEYA